MQTFYGLNVSTQSSDAITHIENFYQQIVSYGLHAEDIVTAAEKHPDNILIQCYACGFHLFAQKESALRKALSYLKRAETLRVNANDWERLTLLAMQQWAKSDFDSAINIFSSLLTLFRCKAPCGFEFNVFNNIPYKA